MRDIVKRLLRSRNTPMAMSPDSHAAVIFSTSERLLAVWNAFLESQIGAYKRHDCYQENPTDIYKAVSQKPLQKMLV